jgi:hypothetical protein
MAVGAEQDVGFLNSLFGLGTHGISHDPGIDDDGFTGSGLDTESRVSQSGEFYAFQIHECFQLLASSFSLTYVPSLI